MLNIKAFKQSWLSKDNELITNLVSKSSDNNVYALGRNSVSELLINKLNLVAVIDDFEETETTWHDLPIIKSKELPEGAIAINCSLSVKPRVAEQVLKSTNAQNVIRYAELHQHSPELFPIPEPQQARYKNYLTHEDSWAKIYNLLEDEQSKELFINILKFNATADYTFIGDQNFAPEQQYFEDFMNYNNEIFVDAGGFTGDTTEIFCNKYPDYNKVYVFEPSPVNINQAKENLAQFERIYYEEKGVSDQVSKMTFDPHAGSASSAKQSGDNLITIETTTIDECFNSAVTFIKMDLEGWEPHALAGAKKMIREHTPKLAISVYHNDNDMWAIAEQILGYNENYKLYLRHYTEGWSETIMYFLPKAK